MHRLHQPIDPLAIVGAIEADVVTGACQSHQKGLLKFRRLAAVVAEDLEADASEPFGRQHCRGVEDHVDALQRRDLSEESDAQWSSRWNQCRWRLLAMWHQI